MDSWLLRTPIAHRGLHGPGVPENSLAAFHAAARRGYAIELDVRLGGGDEAVVFHDASLKRMTGEDLELAKVSVAGLRKLRLRETDEHVPSFAEVLDAIDGRAPLLIELKTPNDRPAGTLEAATWRVLQGYRGAYAVQSFAPATVAWFRNVAPGVPRGQLMDKEIARCMALKRFTHPDFIGCDIRVLPDRRVAATRLPVLAWTVRSPADRVRAGQFADNVIFEGYRA
jgi:glycerophosphoryl diester phosphodiesterase